MTGLDRWRDFVRSHDPKLLWAALDPEVVFESPVVHTPQAGRDIAFKYLLGAEQVLAGPEFRYVGEWRSERGAVLEFETLIEGVVINGVDIITLTEDLQRIARFKVMIRPLKAINLVHRLMAEQLTRMADGPAA
jgi:hypothetical protein